MATHDTQNVSYMRKDHHFLADGIWYVTADCPIHGLVDEEIPWEEAKTPHHAGVIADSRHQECFAKQDEQIWAEARKAEIAAAEYEVERVRRNIAERRKIVSHARREAGDLASRVLSVAEQDLARHEAGLSEAEKRLADVRKYNAE